MKKKIGKMISCVMALGMASATVLSTAGCFGEKIANDENTLEIFISKFGYGTEWLDDTIEEFKKQDWVQAKYPNLSIPTPSSNSERTYPGDAIVSGANANTVDLFFTCMSFASYYDNTDSSGKPIFADLTDVYEDTVPGEDIKVANKMLPSYLASKQHVAKDGSTKYYSMPWVNGYMGLLYNATKTTEYLGADYTLPRTSIELGEMANAIKAQSKVPFISASKVSYWTQVFQTWWMQYEGVTSYDNYWKGVDKYGEYNVNIFSQTGRLRALETLEGLIGRTTGNNHPDVTTLEFTPAQSKFLLGEAVMMPNGDWFENEMRSNYEEDQNHYEIKFMQMPIISAISEKLSYYNESVAWSELSADKQAAYDDVLSAIVAYIDGDVSEQPTEVNGYTVSTNDVAIVREARKCMIGIDSHDAIIPEYATAKELAKDFLRFMATDVACESFMRSTNGASTAFNYDAKVKNPDLYASFSSLQKERAVMALNGLTSSSMGTSKLVYWGGLTSFVQTSLLETYFTSQNAADRKTAKEIYDYEIKYYTDKNNENWNALLTRAGVQN